MENTENTTFNFEQASYTDLLTEAKRLSGLVADLQGDLSTLQNKLMYVEKAFENRNRQVTSAKALITEMIEEDIITDEDYIKQLVEALDLEILKAVEFTLTVEISGTVEIPLGTELDEYSFDVDSITYNGDMVDVDNTDITIERWNFTE